MQALQTPENLAQGPKNYVFVDEHNRHKRLKVMRACEGCRKRKIKCDAATTNSWPCAACKRLKLTCVPPVGGSEGELNVIDTNVDHFNSQIQAASAQQYPPDSYSYLDGFGPHSDLATPYQSYEAPASQQQYSQPDYTYLSARHSSAHLMPQHDAHAQHRYPSFDSTNGLHGVQMINSPQSADSITAEELAETLGPLRISDGGVAPYIRQQEKSQNEAPAPIVDEEEVLPVFSTTAGSQIRIPPALMPSDEEARSSFEDYFRHVHPYVPVLCRSHFMRQWNHERNTISPLLLEAILACAGQVSGDPAGGSQWLALANRHEESFADYPRLSTIQALLLLLKAREKTPKRGYYYRSWITVKKIVGMAKDLDLHEHFDLHQNAEPCDSSPEECLIKTRIWQLAMMIELVVGAPQGRYDFGVDIDTVDVSPYPPNSDIDAYDQEVSRQFAYWVRNVRNIRGMTEVHHKLKRKHKDWATDPKFLAYNNDFRKWPDSMPSDLRIDISFDGSIPRLRSHFLANMHCHYQLGIVMLYKPQLTASKDFANDEKWRYIMAKCYNAAKRVCIIQEATLNQFEILGLASMIRGLSFPIYAILSCVMLHLIAITSPDPEFNSDAKEFFVRHMRLLEKCIKDWPMPEVEHQIQGLREAFSVNLQQPFELKLSFPYGSPSERARSPEERRASEIPHQISMNQNSQMYANSFAKNSLYATPPISVRTLSDHPEQQLFQDFHGEESTPQFQHMSNNGATNNAATPSDLWNPTPIIDQFNTAFAIPQSALAPPPPSSYGSSPPVSISQQSIHPQAQQQQYPTPPLSMQTFQPPHQYHASATSQPIPNPQPYLHQSLSHQPPPQHTPLNYAQNRGVHSYFDTGIDQKLSNSSQQQQNSSAYETSNGDYSTQGQVGGFHAPVYVTPKEWQQSVASVFDVGLKRKRGYEPQLAMQ